MMQVDANFAPLQLDDLLRRGAARCAASRSYGGGARRAGCRDRHERRRCRVRRPPRAAYRRQGTPAMAQRRRFARDRRAGLQLGLPFTDLRANLRGAVERLRFDADARRPRRDRAGRRRGRQGARWQGTLAALRFDPAKGAAWALQQPTRWSWDGASGVLSRSCLASNAGGSLCADADWPRRGWRTCAAKFTRGPLALSIPYLPERGTAGRGCSTAKSRWMRAWFPPAMPGAATRPGLGARGLRNSARAATSSPTTAWRSRPSSTAAHFREAGHALQRRWAHRRAPRHRLGRVRAAVGRGEGEHRCADVDGTVLAGHRRAHRKTRRRPAPRRHPRRAGGRRRGHLQDFATELPSLGIALHEGDLRMQAQPDGNARIVVRVRSGDGVLNVDGTWAGGTGTRRWC